jgi:hypothetical protein
MGSQDADHGRAKAARNQALMREVNERIAEVSEEASEMQLLCECADLSCDVVLDISMLEYESIRSSSVRFPIALGHDLPDVEQVVEQNERYAVVEKVGKAAEVSAKLDPRART